MKKRRLFRSPDAALTPNPSPKGRGEINRRLTRRGRGLRGPRPRQGRGGVPQRSEPFRCEPLDGNCFLESPQADASLHPRRPGSRQDVIGAEQ